MSLRWPRPFSCWPAGRAASWDFSRAAPLGVLLWRGSRICLCVSFRWCWASPWRRAPASCPWSSTLGLLRMQRLKVRSGGPGWVAALCELLCGKLRLALIIKLRRDGRSQLQNPGLLSLLPASLWHLTLSPSSLPLLHVRFGHIYCSQHHVN